MAPEESIVAIQYKYRHCSYLAPVLIFTANFSTIYHFVPCQVQLSSRRTSRRTRTCRDCRPRQSSRSRCSRSNCLSLNKNRNDLSCAEREHSVVEDYSIVSTSRKFETETQQDSKDMTARTGFK